jgi:hypothetical protein
MRDLSPSPLDITKAVFASKATMLRKSSESPPVTCRRFQLLPRSFEKRITPFEPQAQTTTCSPVESGLSAALTPRKLVSIPLVCTDQWTSLAEFTSRGWVWSSLLSELKHGALAVALHNIAATAVKVSVRMRMPRILTIFRAQPRDLCLVYVAAAFRRAHLHWLPLHKPPA